MTEESSQAAVRLLCPNQTEPEHEGFVEYDLIVRGRADGRYLFVCTSCGFHWSATAAQVRRVLTRRMVKQPVGDEE